MPTTLTSTRNARIHLEVTDKDRSTPPTQPKRFAAACIRSSVAVSDSLTWFG